MTADPAARARAWESHLRAGGTTPWLEFADLGTPPGRGTPSASTAVPGQADDVRERGAADLPGAVQLEVLRRLNLTGGEAVPQPLADRVLATAAPGRGQPDRALVGVGDGQAFGPPPVDPSALDPVELLRLVAGVLAEVALAADPGTADLGPSEPDPTRPVPWRRDHRLVGDPALAGGVRAALRDAGHRRGMRSPVVLLLADDLSRVLADVWRWRVTSGATPTWEWWVAHWARRDELPPRADLAAVAARWAERVGRQRVHVVLGPDPAPVVADLLGARVAPGAAYDGLSAAAVETVRHVNGVLRVLTTQERHPGVLARTVVPWLAAETGPHRALPSRHEDWVRRRAARQAAELSAAGYPVHGDPDTVLPGTPAAGRAASRPAPDAVLDVALRTLRSAKEAGR